MKDKERWENLNKYIMSRLLWQITSCERDLTDRTKEWQRVENLRAETKEEFCQLKQYLADLIDLGFDPTVVEDEK